MIIGLKRNWVKYQQEHFLYVAWRHICMNIFGVSKHVSEKVPVIKIFLVPFALIVMMQIITNGYCRATTMCGLQPLLDFQKDLWGFRLAPLFREKYIINYYSEFQWGYRNGWTVELIMLLLMMMTTMMMMAVGTKMVIKQLLLYLYRWRSSRPPGNAPSV